MKLLYNVAIDEPYDDDHPDHHQRDYIYLVWLDEADIAEMVKQRRGEVSYWAAGVCENLTGFMVAWSESQEASAWLAQSFNVNEGKGEP